MALFAQYCKQHFRFTPPSSSYVDLALNYAPQPQWRARAVTI